MNASRRMDAGHRLAAAPLSHKRVNARLRRAGAANAMLPSFETPCCARLLRMRSEVTALPPRRLEFLVGPGRGVRHLDHHEGVIGGRVAVVAALRELRIGLQELARLA